MNTQSNLLPFPGAADAVNLDAIGKLCALLGQIGALARYEDLPDGTAVEVVQDGAQFTTGRGDICDLMEELMDAKDDLLARLGDDQRRMLSASLRFAEYIRRRAAE